MRHELVTHDQLQAALDLAGVDLRASEVQGMICGEICRQLRLGHNPGFGELLGLPAEPDGAGRAVLKSVEALMHQCWRELDAGMNFSLLVPGDDVELEERTGSLADWARGFSLALLRGGQLDPSGLDSNSAEIVRDLLRISEARPGGDPEEDEKALIELQEYIRVGVQVVFEELHPGAEAGNPEREAH